MFLRDTFNVNDIIEYEEVDEGTGPGELDSDLGDFVALIYGRYMGPGRHHLSIEILLFFSPALAYGQCGRCYRNRHRDHR